MSVTARDDRACLRKKKKRQSATREKNRRSSDWSHVQRRNIDEDRKSNLNFDSVYYAINSTYIYLRVEDSNIYI
jgi:hypothetical protein